MMSSPSRRILIKAAYGLLLSVCGLSTGCIGGPDGAWGPSSWSSQDLADDQEFRQEVLKSGFPKASAVGLGDAQQAK